MDNIFDDKPDYMVTAAAKAETSAERESFISCIRSILSTLPEENGERDRAVDVLVKLVKEADTDLRRRMAEKLADEAGAPHQLAVLLANDNEFTVAEPVLKKSLILNDADLIDIVKNKSEEYAAAVAGRNRVSCDLAMIIIATEYPAALKTLVENKGAETDAVCMKKLAEISKKIKEIQEPLLLRREMSTELAATMYWFAGQNLRTYIMDNFSLKAAVIDKNIQASMQSAVDEKSAFTARRDTMLYAQMLNKQGKITSQSLVRTLREKNFDMFCAMMSVKLNLSAECVRIVSSGHNASFLATLCQSAGIGKSDFAAIYLLTRRYTKGKSSMTNPEDLRNIMRTYDETKGRYADDNIAKWRNNPAVVSVLADLSI